MKGRFRYFPPHALWVAYHMCHESVVWCNIFHKLHAQNVRIQESNQAFVAKRFLSNDVFKSLFKHNVSSLSSSGAVLWAAGHPWGLHQSGEGIPARHHLHCCAKTPPYPPLLCRSQWESKFTPQLNARRLGQQERVQCSVDEIRSAKCSCMYE